MHLVESDCTNCISEVAQVVSEWEGALIPRLRLKELEAAILDVKKEFEGEKSHDTENAGNFHDEDDDDDHEEGDYYDEDNDDADTEEGGDEDYYNDDRNHYNVDVSE